MRLMSAIKEREKSGNLSILIVFIQFLYVFLFVFKKILDIILTMLYCYINNKQQLCQCNPMHGAGDRIAR